eukprot:1161118-Prorocentrum_minimum.AAC.1
MTNAPERRVGTGPFGQLKQLEASTAGGAAANAKRCWWEMSVTDERGWARGGLRPWEAGPPSCPVARASCPVDHPHRGPFLSPSSGGMLQLNGDVGGILQLKQLEASPDGGAAANAKLTEEAAALRRRVAELERAMSTQV